MKLKLTSTISLLVIAIIVTGFSMKPTHKPNADYDYLRERLENTKEYTMAVLKAMPDSIYDFRPNQDVRSFKELGYHTLYSIDWNIELMKEKPIKWISGNEDQMPKKELMKYGNEQFDKLLAFVNNAKETKTLTNQIIDVLNHNAHHRGQMVTYLRLKRITPPKYR